MRFSHSLLAAAFACGGAILAQMPTQAQVVEVPFNGGVLASCDEVGVTPGELRPNGLGNSLSSFGGDGAASATLDPFFCNSDTILQLDSITGDEANAVPLSELTCSVSVSSDASYAGNSPLEPCEGVAAFAYGSAFGFITGTTVDLDIQKVTPGDFPADNYSFTVNFNLIPN